METLRLYKKDSKGKIRAFEIGSLGSSVIQKSGTIKEGSEIHGAVSHEKKCVGKNLGKSNETSPSQQADSEALSRYNKKLSGGYFKTIEEARNTRVILPMLAKSLEDVESKIDWELAPFAQPKFDGMRCLAIITKNSIKMISRQGKEISTLPHILSDLTKVQSNLGNNDECILDGELYIHNESFQNIMKLIKKNRTESIRVMYHVYDIVSELPFIIRYGFVCGILAKSGTDFIQIANTVMVSSEKSLNTFHSKCLLNGYEGTIIRHTDDGYKLNSRANQLIKNKDFKDISAKIVDVVKADQRPSWGVPVCEFINDSGDMIRFESNTRLSHADKKDLLKNKSNYIGKIAEIRFFEYTDSGKPRFPVMVGIRLDK